MEKIESRNNEKLKRVRAIRDGKLRDSIFVEGTKLVSELVESRLSIKSAFVISGFIEGPDGQAGSLLNKLKEKGVEIFTVSDAAFSSIADTKTPQGIIAISDRPGDALDCIASRLDNAGCPVPVVVFLEEINNPANLGAMIRTAEAAGACGVITSERSTDAFSPKALRGAMGSAFRSPVVEGMPVEGAAGFASEHGLKMTAAVASGGIPYTDIDWGKKRLLVFGSESHGVSAGLLSKCSERVSIDMQSPVESLNLAVSCGILLFRARDAADGLRA